MVDQEVQALLAALPDARRADAEAIAALIAAATHVEPALWGSSIVGFGTRHYRYASGREGDAVRVGFAARSTGLVLYLTGDLDDYADLLERLGRHRTGAGCLYVKRLADVDPAVLREVAVRSFGADGPA